MWDVSVGGFDIFTVTFTQVVYGLGDYSMTVSLKKKKNRRLGSMKVATQAIKLFAAFLFTFNFIPTVIIDYIYLQIESLKTLEKNNKMNETKTSFSNAIMVGKKSF